MDVEKSRNGFSRHFFTRLTIAECRDRLESATIGQLWEGIVGLPDLTAPIRVSLDERHFVLLSRPPDQPRLSIRAEGTLTAVQSGTAIDLLFFETPIANVIKGTAIGLLLLFVLFALLGHVHSRIGLSLLFAWPLLMCGLLALGLYRSSCSAQDFARSAVIKFLEQVLEATPPEIRPHRQ